MRISLLMSYGSSVVIVTFAVLMDVTLWYPIVEGSGLYSHGPLLMPLSANHPVRREVVKEKESAWVRLEVKYGSHDPINHDDISTISRSNMA